MERHIACVLGIPQRGADLRQVQGLAEEQRREASEVLRKMKAANLRPTKLVTRRKSREEVLYVCLYRVVGLQRERLECISVS